MADRRRRNIQKALLALAILAAILFLKYLTIEGNASRQLQVFRSFFFVFLFAFWGLSLQWCIIHKQIKKWTFLTASLMVFWILIRTIKWHYVSDPDIIRQLWYSFYIPMIGISLLFLFIAIAVIKAPKNAEIYSWDGGDTGTVTQAEIDDKDRN